MFQQRMCPSAAQLSLLEFCSAIVKGYPCALGQYEDTHVVLGSMTLRITRAYIRWDRQKACYPQLHRNKSQHESKAIVLVKGRRKQKTYYKLVRTSWEG